MNLFLRITGRRSDGFHELFSLVQTLSLVDTLTFKSASRDFFSCSDSSLPQDGSNLIIKALHLFRKNSGWDQPFEIYLDKKIPVEAGLGGGSSNAATTLYALNEIAGSPFSEEQLKLMGADLGSDVPVFFSSGTALMSGRGEIIKDRRDLLPKNSFSLFKPSIGLSTPLVYQKFREVGKIVPLHQTMAIEEHLYMNDLEHPAFLIRPELLQIKRELENAGFDRVVMCGSGSAFFCLGEGNPESFSGIRLIYTEPIQRPKYKGWYQT